MPQIESGHQTHHPSFLGNNILDMCHQLLSWLMGRQAAARGIHLTVCFPMLLEQYVFSLAVFSTEQTTTMAKSMAGKL